MTKTVLRITTGMYNERMSSLWIYLFTTLSFVVCFYYATRSWSYRRSYLHRLILVIEAGYALWAFSLISTLAVDDLQFKVFMTHLRMLLVPLIFPAWTLIVATLFLPGIASKLRKYWYIVFSFPMLIVVANLLAMSGLPAAEKWIFYDFALMPEYPGMVTFTRGRLLQASFVFHAFCTLVAFCLALYAIYILRGVRRKYATILVLVGLWPILLEAVHLWAPLEFPWRQVKIMALWPFVLGLHYAASKVDILEITTLAQQKVFEKLPNPIIILNTRGEYWGGNEAAASVLGVKQSWQGRPVADLPELARLAGAGENYRLGDRSYRVLRHSLDFHGGEEQAQIIVLMDVSEIEESNRTLRDLNSEISRMYRYNKRVQSVIMHDLSGSLGSAQMLLQGVQKEMEKENTVHLSLIEKVNEAQQSSLELLRDILTWSYEEESMSVVSLRERVDVVLRHLTPQIIQKNAVLEVNLPEQDVPLWGSARVVEAVLRNLLSNAVKFSPERGRIQISATFGRGFADVEIADEGPGISNSPSSNDSSAVGFGMGLKFTQDFVLQMGGELSFHANTPKGTKVLVRLPLLSKS